MCDGCGQSLHESTCSELEGAYEVTALVCHACSAREHQAREMSDERGVKFAVSLSEQARRWLAEREG